MTWTDAELEALGRAISSVERPRPERRAVERMRRRVLTAEARPAWPWLLVPQNLLRLAAMAVAVLVVFTGAKSVADASWPGDPGFALKVALDHAQVLVEPDPLARLAASQRELDRRLDDLVASAAPGSPRNAAAVRAYTNAIDELTRALEDARQRVGDAPRLRAVVDVDSACDRHLRVLEELEQRIGPDIAPALAKIRAFDARVDALRHELEDQDGAHGPAAPGGTARPLATGGPDRGPGDSGATAEPTRTPDRTETPRPTDTPRPTATPQPTATPHPTDTPNPGGGGSGR